MADEAGDQRYALRMVIDGQERKITYEELALSNNLSQEALVRLLVKKKIIKADDLLEEIKTVKGERYRADPQDPGASSS
jgi:hypothetical protein